jgi:hypothetical protein
MSERYVSDPIELPVGDEAQLTRIDLIFYGVDHSGSSFEARVFLDHPDADVGTPRDDPRYGGSFHVFGHGRCYGDHGHCEVPTGPPDPFDLRPPHQLTPHVKLVTVTEAIKGRLDAGADDVRVTVVAETPGDRSNDVLRFDRVRLASYE